MNRPLPHSPIFAVVIVLAAIALCPGKSRAAPDQITVATWSGVYAEAQEAALFKSFTRETGIGIRIEPHDGDLTALSARGSAAWTAVDMERGELDAACADGRVRRIDPVEVLGQGAADDFVPGTLHPCGIASSIWTQAVAYDGLTFKAQKPTSLGDFFDLVRFPGRRGLAVTAVGTLETALLADGIPREDVYDVLSKPGGVQRALAKLDTLGGDVVFWRGGDEPASLLNDGTVVMTTAYAGRFLRPRQGARRPVGLLREQSIWRATYWAIPRTAPDVATAYRFVSYATDPVRLADLATRLWFGPARKSGQAALPPNVREEMPTARKYFHDALQIDAAFWRDHGADVEAIYAGWRRKTGEK